MLNFELKAMVGAYTQDIGHGVPPLHCVFSGFVGSKFVLRLFFQTLLCQNSDGWMFFLLGGSFFLLNIHRVEVFFDGWKFFFDGWKFFLAPVEVVVASFTGKKLPPKLSPGERCNALLTRMLRKKFMALYHELSIGLRPQIKDAN